MPRACCERVASMLQTRLRATSNIRSLSPPPPCCDYIMNMLRPMLRVTSSIKSSPLSPPRHKSQHHMSATSKFNICNIKIYCLQHSTTCVCKSNSTSANVENECLQHRKIYYLIFETLAWDT
jgi:hypothetical protein